MKTYASGIDIRRSFDLLATLRSLGFRSFKVKVGFDLAQDIVQIGALSQSFLPAEHLSADANQAWSLDEVVNIE